MGTGTGTTRCFLIERSKIMSVVVGQQLACACRTTLCCRVRVETDDSAVDGTSPSSIIPVLRPVLADRPPGLAHVLEVRAAEVLVLLDVEPEVEHVLGALALQKETVPIVSLDDGANKGVQRTRACRGRRAGGCGD